MGGLGAEIDASLTILPLHTVQAVDIGLSQPGIAPRPSSTIVSTDVHGAMIGAGKDQAADRLFQNGMDVQISERSVRDRPARSRALHPNDALIRADEDI